MTSYILFFLAGCFNGIMDTLAWRYSRSVFKNLDQKWWNPNVNWMHLKPFLGWMRIDPWHIAKTIMVLLLAGAANVGCASHPWYIFFPVAWFCWGVGFEIIWRALERK